MITLDFPTCHDSVIPDKPRHNLQQLYTFDGISHRLVNRVLRLNLLMFNGRIASVTLYRRFWCITLPYIEGVMTILSSVPSKVAGNPRGLTKMTSSRSPKLHYPKLMPCVQQSPTHTTRSPRHFLPKLATHPCSISPITAVTPPSCLPLKDRYCWSTTGSQKEVALAESFS